MAYTYDLIGRQQELDDLSRRLSAVRESNGGLVLLAGEAGVGKTRLAEESLAKSGLLNLQGRSNQEATPPYGPIVAVLRSYLRVEPDGFAVCGPLCEYLALLLPELGPAADGGDQATLFEAIRCAFEAIATSEAAVVFLDDLQWADNATLELMPALVASLEAERLLIIGAYRSDEILRGHPIRRLRNELRRARMLHEISIEPLNLDDTAALATEILGQTVSPALTTTIHDKTLGVPFFVEELASALHGSGRLRQSDSGVELVPGENVPIPETVRDAVLLRLDGLSDQAQTVLEVAAVAGLQFDLHMVVELTGEEDGLQDLIERSLITESEPGQGEFRHALSREAIYGEIIWTRRRALHRQIATQLQSDGAASEVIAEHWMVAREPGKALQALIVSAEKSCSVHAYLDAVHAADRALEIWPEGEDESKRLDVLDRLGHCAQLSGMLPEAVRAWREVEEGHRKAGDNRELADIERRLATVYELQGAWDRALEARRSAADAFAASDLPGEAAAERLAGAAHLQGAGSFSAARELVAQAKQEADAAGRQDLKVLALVLEGRVRAKQGEVEVGQQLVQEGLSLALENNLTGPAIEAYEQLGTVMENASDYIGARDAYLTAFNFCEARGDSSMAQVCLSCFGYVLRHTGDWDRAENIAHEVMDSAEAPPGAHTIAAALLGTIYAWRGQASQARPLLLEAFAQARQDQFMVIEFESAWGLACVDELNGEFEAAAEQYRFVLDRWEQTEDVHYVVPTLRWASTFFAGQGAATDTRACAEALARIATRTGNPEALAALAHALGEAALLDNDREGAARQFVQALELLRKLEVPFERAQTQIRAGVVLAATQEREAGIAHLVNAYHTARKLGARPLAAQAAQELQNLGEQIDERLGRRAAGRLKRGGLTLRQLEVLRLIALGKTNKEIAGDLFLSPRTVDMHVGNILTRLDSRSRTEAVRRAGELDLLEGSTQ